MKERVPEASNRRIARVLEIDRARLGEDRVEEATAAEARREAEIDETVAARIHELIKEHPTFGYRRIWALLRFGDKRAVNRKKVQWIMQLWRWQCTQRQATPRPRVGRSRSRTDKSNERWSMDVTHIDCGADSWGHLVAILDCHDREVVGWEFALRGRAREAERALEAACLRRFGTLRPAGETPVIRSDNGLIFQSRRFREACRFYRLCQEYITPYTPEQNGLVERFFRSIKEECVWQHRFASFEEAYREIARWIRWYNGERPHQALGDLSPKRHREKLRLVA